MADLNGQPGFVGQLLQFELPQPHARSIGAAAIGGDQQPSGVGIAFAADCLPPARIAFDGERRGVVVDADD